MYPRTQGKELGKDLDPSHDVTYRQHFGSAEKLTALVLRSIVQNGGNYNTDMKRTLNVWCTQNSETKDFEGFKGTSQKIDLQYIHSQVDQLQIYSTFDFFESCVWPWRFEKKFYNKVIQMKVNHMIHLFCFLSDILDGGFDSGQHHMKVQQVQCSNLQPYSQYFQAEIPGGKTILFYVGIEKLPKIQQGTQMIYAFHCTHCIRFIDILQTKDISNIKNSAQKFQSNIILKDPARSDFGYIIQKGIKSINIQQDITQGYSAKKQKYENQNLFMQEVEALESNQFTTKSSHTVCQFNEAKKPARLQPNKLQTRWVPTIFALQYLTIKELAGFVYSTTIERWVPLDFQSALERNQFQAYQAQINREILTKYADFSSAGKLVELLQKIPNFRIKLTEEEQNVVGAPGNLMVIGRSGTGKTTCAVLRMFAMELLFKLRIQLYKEKHQAVLQDTRFSPDDIDGQIGLHCIFATASPVLTNEVQRYYTKLTEQVKQELDKKKLRVKLEREEKERLASLQKQQIDDSFEIMEASLGQFDEQITKQQQEEDFIQAQIEDIALQEEQEGFNDDQDEDIDREESELKEKMDKFVSLADLKDNQFPAFLTIRKLILMIDGAMLKPFFSRDYNKKVVGTDSKANWHNENQGVLMINKNKQNLKITEANDDNTELDLENQEEFEVQDVNFENDNEVEQEYARQMYLQNLKKTNDKTKKSIINLADNILAKEIDYDIFFAEFWVSSIIKQYQFNDQFVINSTMVWTEIFSYIKGSAQSHEYPGCYLPKRLYLINDGRMLTEKMKETVYEIFIQYERWKNRTNYYDLQDVVNYLLGQFKYGRYSGAPVHYLMIDEVQDLSHSTLLLLSKITEQGLFFSGDTAQNIAKGVGFRFCDLKSLFQQKYFGSTGMSPPVLKQLTVNFRSHNQILEVANSLVTLIELFFPKTIDRLKKEKSNLVGPKPIILEGTDIDLLFFVLSGQEKYQSQQQTNRPPLEFGCNQVIIVKDQESKKQLPSMLQHALCLTIYEAKGLEFDDVILFNFFCDSNIPEKQWNLINYINNIDQWIDKQVFYNDVTQHKTETKQIIKTFDDTSSGSDSQSDDDEEKDTEHSAEQPQQKVNQVEEDNPFNANIFNLQEKGDKVLNKRLQVDPNFYNNINIIEYSQLCVELKQLYVAVTRPRNRLIIYDQNLAKRAKIQKLWQQLDLVQIITQNEVQQILNQSQSDSVLQFKEVANKTQKSEWKKQGLKMLRNRFYEQAIKCFHEAQEPIIENRARAYNLAEIATKQMTDVQVERNTTTKDKKQQRIINNRIKLLEQESRSNFLQAAELFRNDGKLKLCAQCLYSAEKYAEAQKLYEGLELWNQAGGAAFNCQEWEIAAEYFDRDEDYIRAIDCYEKIHKWEKILQIIHKYKATMNIQTREAYLKLYLPIALDEILQEVDTIPQVEDITAKNLKIEQPTLKIQEIEEDEDEDDEDNDEDQYEDGNFFEESVFEEHHQQIQEQIQQPQLEKQVSDERTEEFSKISFQESFVEKVDEEVDPGIISFSKTQSNLTEQEKISQFDHLSHIDFEDEFIKGDRQSLMESIQSGRQSEASYHSEFSAISFTSMSHNPKMQLVKTKGDIYIQDNVMQRIIRFISMFSEDFKYSLLQQKSRAVQLTQQTEQNGKPDSEFDYMIDFILDLDLVDLDFIHLVLDTLEQFKQYKLCIFVCNRYKLASKVGRYLSSIGARYSPLALEPIMMKQILIQDGSSARQQKLDQSRVAQFALHLVLENINPDYLGMKFPDEEQHTQSLGLQCFQQLAQLGYWKKCLYALDYHNALQLAQSFSDYSNWKYISLTYRMKKQMVLNNDPQSKEKSQSEQKKLQNLLDLCFQESMVFETWPFVHPNTQEDYEFALMTYEEYFQKVLQQFTTENILPIKTFQCTFAQVNTKYFEFSKDQRLPDQFILTQKLINLVINQADLELLQLIEKITIDLTSLLKKSTKLNPLEQIRLQECIYLTILLFSIMFNSPNQIGFKTYFNDLPHNIYLDLFSAVQKIFKVLQQGISHHHPYILRACLGFYKARVSESDILKHIVKGQAIVSRQSPLINDLLEIRQELIQEQEKKHQEFLYAQEIKAQYMKHQQNEIETKLDREGLKQLREKQKQEVKLQIHEEMFFIDLDLNFVMVPLKYVIQAIQKRIKNSLYNILRSRLDQVFRQYNNCQQHYSTQREALQQMTFFLACMTIKKNLTSVGEINRKNKIITQDEKALSKYKKDDPLRAFVLFEQRRQKEQNASQLRMQVLHNMELDETIIEDFGEDLQDSKLNKKKAWGSSDQGMRKAIIYYINGILMNTQDRFQGKLHPQIYESLLSLGLSYLQKAGKNHDPQITHKYFIRGILILNYINKSEHALSRLRYLQKTESIKNKKLIVGYRNFIEYLEVKKLFIVADSCELLFEFFKTQSALIFPDEQCAFLESAIINSLLATLTNKKKKVTLLLPFCNLQTLPGIKTLSLDEQGLEQYEYIAPVCSVEDDLVLTEALYWLGHALKDVVNMVRYANRLAILFFSVIINIQSFSEDLCEQTLKIISQLGNFDKLEEILYKNQGWKNISRASDPVSLVKAKATLLDKDNQFVFEIWKQSTLHKVTFTNSIKSIDDAYDQSYRDWIKLDLKNSKYITNIRPIMKTIKNNSHKTQKLQKLMKDSALIHYLGNSILGSALNYQQLAFWSQHIQLIEISLALIKFRTLVCCTFYQTFVNNSLDFLYISMMMGNIYEKENNYMTFVVKFFKGEIIQKDIYKEFIDLKREVGEYSSSFDSWKKTNIKFEISLEKLVERNRKIMALKWMKKQTGIQGRMQKLLSKRTGQKKQEALQNKKLLIKKK